MACDEFFHRHFHKKITHTHPHVKERRNLSLQGLFYKEDHHHHAHLKEEEEAGMADEKTARHLHEHTHEATEHEHPAEHDPFHPCDESKMHTTKKSLKGENKSEMQSHGPIQTEEK